jgi:urease accessory protein
MATTTDATLPAWLPFLLQTNDATFPSGGYAHSLGLEEMTQSGRVRDEATLIDFLRRHVVPALEHLELPLVREAHRAAGDLDRLLEIDRLASALKLPRELREASLQTGRRRLATLLRVRPTPGLAALQAAIESTPNRGHHAIVWGAACADLPATVALGACFYQTAACQCMAAPKILRLGQEAAQRALAATLEHLPLAVERALAIPLDEIGWFDPALDLASMRHELAHERLFIS